MMKKHTKTIDLRAGMYTIHKHKSGAFIEDVKQDFTNDVIGLFIATEEIKQIKIFYRYMEVYTEDIILVIEIESQESYADEYKDILNNIFICLVGNVVE